jgi:hypothetical protein
MDLPSSVFLGFYARDDGTAALDPDKPSKAKDDAEADQDDDAAEFPSSAPAEAKRPPDSVY